MGITKPIVRVTRASDRRGWTVWADGKLVGRRATRIAADRLAKRTEERDLPRCSVCGIAAETRSELDASQRCDDCRP